jgi:hypothetical protein
MHNQVKEIVWQGAEWLMWGESVFGGIAAKRLDGSPMLTYIPALIRDDSVPPK